MVPQTGPNAGLAADLGVVTARRVGRDRLAIARRDFLLDPAARLSEQQRAAMDRMLRHLLDQLAERLRALLPEPLASAAGIGEEPLFDRLAGAGMLDRADLIGVLLRFAAGERVASAAARTAAAGAEGGPAGRGMKLLDELAQDRQPAIAAAAAAMIAGHQRRRDSFGRQILQFDDLPPPVAAELATAVAVAQRRSLLNHAGGAEVDAALATGARLLLAERDPSGSIESLAAGLAAALDGSGRLDDEVAVRAGAAGDLDLLVALLARRSGLAATEASLLLLGAPDGGLALLLGLARLPRAAAAALVAGIGLALGVTDPLAELVRFDRLDQAAVAADLAWLGLSPAYRAAVRALEEADGQRSF